MGRKNNVNPDHYKTAGRERQGEDIVQAIHRQEFTQTRAAQRGESRIPATTAHVAKTARRKRGRARRETGQANESADSTSSD